MTAFDSPQASGLCTKHGTLRREGNAWPFITGFNILPETADILVKNNISPRIAIVCDSAGQRLFLPQLADSLRQAGMDITPPQEAACFLFMGGQSTMKVAHRFALHPSCPPYALLPTTLMGMCSGAAGPATCHPGWHAPLFSLCDAALAESMEKRHFRSNYAHVARLAMATDEPLFSWLEWWGAKAIAGDADARLAIIRKSILLTQKIANDPARAAAPELGEDFAQALMRAGHFSQALLPGEALALGIRVAFGLSARLGYCPLEDAARMRKHLQNAGFQTSLRKSRAPYALHPPEVMAEMSASAFGTPSMVLLRGIGKSFLAHDIDPDDMAAVIDKVLSE